MSNDAIRVVIEVDHLGDAVATFPWNDERVAPQLRGATWSPEPVMLFDRLRWLGHLSDPPTDSKVVSLSARRRQQVEVDYSWAGAGASWHDLIASLMFADGAMLLLAKDGMSGASMESMRAAHGRLTEALMWVKRAITMNQAEENGDTRRDDETP